jgi:hypothetical protein
MRKSFLRMLLAESILTIGILSTILGGSILFTSASGGSRFAAVLASLCLSSGVLLAIVSFKLREKQARFIFLSSFLILTGALLLCIASGLIPYSIFRLWPLLSVFSGLSLFPAGFHRYSGPRARFVVPALVFILLGIGFLLFSFRWVPFSFSRFILTWWPLLLVLAGALLMLVSLSARSSGTEESDP